MKTLYIDLETRSKLDIDEVGTDNYARACQILMLGWALDEAPVQMWFPTTKMPEELHAALLNPEVLKIAWYVPFEFSGFKYQLGMHIPIEQWRDPSVLSKSLSMPGKLDRVCDILKIGAEKAKIKGGKQLIDFFCTPNGEDGQETLFGVSDGFNSPREYPDKWAAFVEYCRRDVEIERTLWKFFQKFSFPEEQWKDWFMDQEMNQFGLPVNVERARHALALADRYKKESKETLNLLTGLANANSRDQLLGWLMPRGYSWGSLNKTYVEAELKNPASKITDDARDVLLLRQKSSQNSYKKLENILLQISPDGRLRYQFSYMGAARTGRWSSGGGINVQNLPRPTKEFKKFVKTHGEDAVFHLIDTEDYDNIKKEFDGSTLPFVASCIRNLIEVSQ